MKTKKFLFSLLGFSFAALTVVSLASSFLAWNPADLKPFVEDAPPPVTVQLAEPAQKEEPPEPPPTPKEASLLSTLAPDSFAGPQDFGSGVAFGSGGFGPAVGGGGGFGSDASSLVRDGASVNRPPRLLMKGSLEYPSEARQRSISGYVSLKILVSTNGMVDNVEVEESEPRGFFEQAAMKSVRTWKFEPAMIKGQIVAAWTSQKIKFELN
jgi:periplasmic protein TonB